MITVGIERSSTVNPTKQDCEHKQQQQRAREETDEPIEAEVVSPDKTGDTPSGRRRLQKDPDVEAIIERVLEAWKVAMNYPKAKLTPNRRGIVRARLREGTTEDEMLTIIGWAKHNTFLRGKNDNNRAYDDVDTLFRSADRVEKYLTNASRDTSRFAKSTNLAPRPAGAPVEGVRF